MDKKDKNYIPPGSDRYRSGYGRRINGHNYNIDRAKKELNEKRDEQRRKQAVAKLRKKRRMRALRIRALLAVTVIAIITVIVLFFTPLLNIQGFNVSGNSIVTNEEITSRLEPLKGTNLIMLSESDVIGQLSDLSYIEGVSVAKFLIPPSAMVNIQECVPAARIDMNGFNIIIDPQLKVLSDGDEFDTDAFAHIDGLNVPKYSIGKTLTLSEEDSEKTEVLATCLQTMNSLEMLNKLDYIDLTDITNIRFGYDDRIDALCGTRLELERKIRKFDTIVNGGNIDDNARGIIDLSVSGKAIYTP